MYLGKKGVQLMLSEHFLGLVNRHRINPIHFHLVNPICSCAHAPPSPSRTPVLQRPLYLFSTAAWLIQTILEEDTASLSSPWSGGMLRVIYECSLQLVWSSHSRCVPGFTQPVEQGERGRKEETSESELQQTVGDKELEGSKHWWAERRRLSSFTHPSSQAA